MREVSTAWATANDGFLAPEGFVELSCYVPELKDTLVYTKSDLLSFTHHQTGSLVAGELPKNHIEFSLDNSDGKWNPSAPAGLERYLSERLKITLRYGFNINGVTEWIPGGVFYLSEWSTSTDGLNASFVARDLMEYMLDKPYTGTLEGTLYEIAQRAIEEAGVPPISGVPFVLGSSKLGAATIGATSVAPVSLSDELKKYTVGEIEYDGSETIAVILQKCANAAGCVMYQNRAGVLVIEKLIYEETNYVVPKKLAYSYPKIDFYRPLKNVSVTYGENQTYLFHFGGNGETQTVSNDFIKNEEQAASVAKWVTDSLRSRKVITGEFRGDPRIDLFDVVKIENKYGSVAGVVLTDVKIQFTGAFRVSYSGYIRGSGTAVIVYSGEKYSGEVN